MVKQTYQSIKDFYRVFTSGLNSAEIERLVSADARGMYAFYVKNMRPSDQSSNKVMRFFRFTWYLFLAFLTKLTPGRRLFYAIAFVLMVLALTDDDLAKGFYSFLILNFLLALELADKLVTKDELEFARQIQLSLLPDQLLPLQGFTLASHSEVAQNVGGDYYDLIPLANGSTIVVIADVSGKGISAALYMAKVQTALQMLSREAEDPKDLLVRLNRYMYGKLKKNFFLTISVMEVRPDGTIRYCRAGHTPALMLDAHLRSCAWLQPRGTAIGLVAPEAEDSQRSWENGNGEGPTLFAQSLEEESFTLKHADTVILYTDGVLETVNRTQEEFGEGRLMQVLLDSNGEGPERIKEKLLQRLLQFRNGEELRDDTTFVVLQRV